MSILMIGLCLPGMVACSKASEDECDQAYERLIEIRVEGQPAEVQKVKRSQLKRIGPVPETGSKVRPEVIRCWLNSNRKKNSRSATERCAGIKIPATTRDGMNSVSQQWMAWFKEH